MSYVAVLDAVRNGPASTRPEIADVLHLGRNLVAQRVAWLLSSGLLAEGELSRSTGGRAPRNLRLPAEAGRILVAELDALYLTVASADLQGGLTGFVREAADINDGPERILNRVADLFEQKSDGVGVPLWGIGLGLPGPIEFASGRPVSPPIMPGWNGYDVRGHLSQRFQVPVWVDNDVNVMAFGEHRKGLATSYEDVIYVKVSTGIGAGLICGGRLNRGSQGSAGDIGHIPVEEGRAILCRCGKLACLEATAGGGAIVRDAETLARTGDSPALAAVLQRVGSITLTDVIDAARRGDRTSNELLVRSARMVGELISRVTNVLNPSLILIGGDVTEVGDVYLAEVRQVVFQRAMPLATRALRIEVAPDGDLAGLRGCAFMVIDNLLAPDVASRWISRGSPVGVPDLV
jgi:predicted NBD/HSP70 family sugar kinase